MHTKGSRKRMLQPKISGDEAIRTLGKGDHYILVLCNHNPEKKRPPHDFLRLLFAGILLTAFMMLVLCLLNRESKSPLLSRVILYPLMFLAAGFLVKYLGTGKNSKT